MGHIRRTYKLFHDCHFCCNIVKGVCCAWNCLFSKSDFIHNFHCVELVCLDVEAEEHLWEGTDTNFLHDLILIYSLLAAYFGRHTGRCGDACVSDSTDLAHIAFDIADLMSGYSLRVGSDASLAVQVCRSWYLLWVVFPVLEHVAYRVCWCVISFLHIFPLMELAHALTLGLLLNGLLVHALLHVNARVGETLVIYWFIF
jgi:hypothetical protein